MSRNNAIIQHAIEQRATLTRLTLIPVDLTPSLINDVTASLCLEGCGNASVPVKGGSFMYVSYYPAARERGRNGVQSNYPQKLAGFRLRGIDVRRRHPYV